MKLLATLIFSAALCGIVSAAPMTTASSPNTALATEVLGGSSETASATRNTDAEFVSNHWANEAPIPEPASLALLGIGLGLAAMRRRKQ